MSYVFGPVPSRRLGRSLGVDIVPFKTCSYDCIYCQLGRTTCKTIERKEWVPIDPVLESLKNRLSAKPDYITLSGSGEPTLHSRIGELIGRIKSMTDIPVAVLTNGSLLWQPEMRRQLSEADLIVPSLDAGDEAIFKAVNRPHEEIAFDTMLSGLVQLRRECRAQYWLEVFVLAGYTSVRREIEKLVRCVEMIEPDRVQLNTVARPPTESYAVGVARERMEKFAAMFTPHAEVIADFRGVHKNQEFTASREEVLGMLKRRPCSVDDIAEGLAMHRNEVVKYIEELLAKGNIEQSLVEGRTYYKPVGR